MLEHVKRNLKRLGAAPGGEDPDPGRRPGMAVVRRPKKVVRGEPFVFKADKLSQWRSERKKLLRAAKRLGDRLAGDARRAMDPAARLARPHRVSRADRDMLGKLVKLAKDLKTHGHFWGKPLSATVGGMDFSRPDRVVGDVRLPGDAHKVLEHITHEFKRPIYDPKDRYTVLRGSKHVRHRDYRHRIIMPAPGDKDGYRKIAMKTLPTLDELEKKKHHFYKVGLMADFVSDIKMSKNIQVRLFKNLIEIIVKGTRVVDKELYVLAHFLSKRPGSLYAVRGRDLSLIFEIEKGTSDSNVARYLIRE